VVTAIVPDTFHVTLWVLRLATSPFAGVMLLTKHVMVYKGLSAATAADVCLNVTVTLEPQLVFSVWSVFAVAASLIKSIVMLEASRPLI
jgi:hypothetical protein